MRVIADITVQTELEVPDDYFEDTDDGCTMAAYIARHIDEYKDDIVKGIEAHAVRASGLKEAE